MFKLYRQSPLTAFSGNDCERDKGGNAVIDADGLSIREQIFISKLLLQGDSQLLAAALEQAFGLSLPVKPNTRSEANGCSCLWLRPKQWLLLSTEFPVSSLQYRLQTIINKQSAYITNVTDKFQMLEVSGVKARELLATGCNLNLSEKSFTSGQCAQSRIEQVPIILYGHDNRFFVLVERTLTYHLWLWFREASREFSE